MKGHMRPRSDAVWELNVDIGKDAQRVRRRHSETYYGAEADAETRLREMVAAAEAKIAATAQAGPQTLTVGEWLLRWHQRVIVRDKRISTQERYLSIINLHLIPHIGPIPLKDLSPLKVDALHGKLLDEGLAPKTIELIHTVLSGACSHAVRLEIIDRNPAAAAPPPSAPRKKLNIPVAHAVLELLRLAEEDMHYLCLFIHVLVYTGMRRGEAMALRWRNVHLGEAYLFVEESTVKTHRKGLVLETPKTETSIRRIFLDERTVDLLARRQEDQLRVRPQMDPEDQPTDNDLVFPTEDGGWMKPSNMLRDLKKLACRVGIPNLTFHAMRHFHASVILDADDDLYKTSRRLGHSSIATTADLYGHTMERGQRSIAQVFTQAMENERKNHKAHSFPPDRPPNPDPPETD